MPSEASVRVVKFPKNSEAEFLFDARRPSVTEVTCTCGSIGTEEDSLQPYIETARRHPLHDNGDQAQSSCIDLQGKGEADQLAEEEGHKNRLLIQSLIMNVL